MPVSLMREHTGFVSKNSGGLVVGRLSNISLCTEIIEAFSLSSDCSVFASYPVSRFNILALAQDPRNSYSRFLQLYTVSAVFFSLDLYLLSCLTAMSHVQHGTHILKMDLDVMVDFRIDGCQATWYVRLSSIGYFQSLTVAPSIIVFVSM